MSLEITFNEEAFATVTEPAKNFDKPEFKKFNMRFNNLDLVIIDAIAKRDGTSRSQIINGFIENILKDFVYYSGSKNGKVVEPYIPLVIAQHAESLYDSSVKSDKTFAWDLWYISTINNIDTEAELYNELHLLNDEIESKNASKKLLNTIEILKQDSKKR